MLWPDAHRYFKDEALYSFDLGLSYTRFDSVLAANQFGDEDETLGYVVAPGEFGILIEASSADVRQSARLTVAGSGDPEPVARTFFAAVATTSVG